MPEKAGRNRRFMELLLSCEDSQQSFFPAQTSIVRENYSFKRELAAQISQLLQSVIDGGERIYKQTKVRMNCGRIRTALNIV